MTSTGRKPQPLEVRRRHGRAPGRDSGGRKLPEPVVVLPAAVADGVPEPPAGLMLAGQAMWSDILAAGATWMANTDLIMVEQVCLLVDDRELARERFKATREPQAGRLVNQMSATIASMLGSLGFDPTARGRLGVAEVKTRSKLEELLAKRAERG